MALKSIYASHSDLILGRDGSNMNADLSSGISTMTVYSISQFETGQILLLNKLGSENAEIIKTHASTAPTGKTVTLASGVVKDHTKDTVVKIISYDQVEFSHAVTTGGAKTILTTDDIDVERMENLYEDSTYTSGYYYVRYYNSIDSVFSDYSDPIPYAGMPVNTVGYAIETAMTELGAEFSARLTFDMLIKVSQQMLRLVRGKLKSWSKYQEYDYTIDPMIMGMRSVDAPETLYDKNSNRSILNLRLGNNTPLTYIDRSEYLQATKDTYYTEVATEAAATDTSLVLDDTSNLPESGDIAVYVSGVKYTILYTANNETTNTLTVDSDQITVTLTVNSPTWYNVIESVPDFYSVWDGKLYLWPLVDSTHANLSLKMDFYTDIETIDSQMDVINGTKYDMLVPYLKWKIRAILYNKGKEDLKDPSLAEFRELLKDAKMNESSAENESFRPRQASIYGGRKHNSRR